MAKIRLRWLEGISSRARGEVGEGIGKAYLMEKLPEQIELFDEELADCELRVYDSNGTNNEVTVEYADTDRRVGWVPDINFSLTEHIDLEERKARRESQDRREDVRRSRDVYAEVKTTTRRGYPSDKISDNQSEIAHHLSLQDDTIVIALLITFNVRNLRVHTYQMTEENKWEQVKL